MPVKRRNAGRAKKHRGNSINIRCSNCHRMVPKDKAIKRYLVKNIVDLSSKRDIEDASVYTKYDLPKFYVKSEWCVSCAIHARIVKVRSKDTRKIRHPTKVRLTIEKLKERLARKERNEEEKNAINE